MVNISNFTEERAKQELLVGDLQSQLFYRNLKRQVLSWNYDDFSSIFDGFLRNVYFKNEDYTFWELSRFVWLAALNSCPLNLALCVLLFRFLPVTSLLFYLFC